MSRKRASLAMVRRMAKIDPEAAPLRIGSGYPAPFHEMSRTREKRALGDAGGLTDFGVNLVTLPPGEWSSQRHWHEHEDEFVLVLAGEVMLVTDAGETPLGAGDCAAFPKGLADGHHLVNHGTTPARYLEIGTRSAADTCHYPDIDLLWADERYSRKEGGAL